MKYYLVKDMCYIGGELYNSYIFTSTDDKYKNMNPHRYYIPTEMQSIENLNDGVPIAHKYSVIELNETEYEDYTNLLKKYQYLNSLL